MKLQNLIHILMGIVCIGLLPRAQAVLPPPVPDGEYPNNNTAEGSSALQNLTNGQSNTAVGRRALFANTGGSRNNAIGAWALSTIRTGTDCTANGFGALKTNTASANTAIGSRALELNTTGSSNIAVGNRAGRNLTTGANNIDIGNEGVAGEGSTIRIGRSQATTFIAGISGAVISGAPVVVNADGQLGTTPSSQRFKDEIKSMDQASEAILALKPVTFRYKKELDPEALPQFGLVAEEVEAVNSDLVLRDKEGKPYTVRYEAVNAMLLNEFLKQHKRVEEQQSKIEQQEATIAQLKQDFESKLAQQQKQIEALTAGLQKVSAQVEVSKPAPQVVNNP